MTQNYQIIQFQLSRLRVTSRSWIKPTFLISRELGRIRKVGLAYLLIRILLPCCTEVVAVSVSMLVQRRRPAYLPLCCR